MKTSETIVKIYGAVIEAQGQMPTLKKSEVNPFFKSKYVALPDLITVVFPILHQNGLAVMQFPGAFLNGSLEITTRLIHISGEWIEETAMIPLQKTDPQGFGSALTYGKRYSICAILGISEDTDDDANSAVKTPPVVQSHQKEVITAKSGISAQPAVSVKASDKPKEPKRNITAQIIGVKRNDKKDRTEYEVETPELEHYVVFVKKPMLTLSERQEVEVIGFESWEYKGVVYHKAEDVKAIAVEEIPF